MQVICYNEFHCHNSPIQNMVTMEINMHIVEITQDGNRFNVRADDGPAEYNLTPEQLDQFVKDNT
jgi:hypothetical protein